MSNFFGFINEVDYQNKSRQYNLALEKFWVVQCGWIILFLTFYMLMNITNRWKLFSYGVLIYITIKIYWYQRVLGTTRSWLIKHPFFNWYWESGNNIPLLDDVDGGEIVSTWRSLQFSSFASCAKEFITIYGLSLDNDSLSDSVLVDFTFGYQHIDKKEGTKEGGRYNRTTICYYNGILTNGKIFPKIALWVLIYVLGSTRRHNTVKK